MQFEQNCGVSYKKFRGTSRGASSCRFDRRFGKKKYFVGDARYKELSQNPLLPVPRKRHYKEAGLALSAKLIESLTDKNRENGGLAGKTPLTHPDFFSQEPTSHKRGTYDHIHQGLKKWY